MRGDLGDDVHTMAVMLFPDGPVTEMHAPQLADVSQFESDKAVPKIPEGIVYVEKEHATPATLPP